MKANYNSFTAKLYRWFYVDYWMPTNLCPYFWKCVLMYALIIPYSVINIPSIVLDILDKDDQGISGPFQRLFMSMFLWLVIFSFGFATGTMIYFAIAVWSTDFSKPISEMLQAGLFFWGLGVLIGIIFALVHLIKALMNRAGVKVSKPKSDNMVKSFIKAKYKKYCPKIDWE